MASKFSPIKDAITCMKLLVVIVIITLPLSIKYSGNFLAFVAFLVSVMALLVSVAIPVNASTRGDVEKRLECFYKPIEQLIESSVDLENRHDELISRLKEIRRYDHLAKDETTRDLFRQLTSTAVISKSNKVCKIERLLEHVKKDIIYYEKILADLSSR